MRDGQFIPGFCLSGGRFRTFLLLLGRFLFGDLGLAPRLREQVAIRRLMVCGGFELFID